MKNMSLLYAHEWTQTLCVTDQTPESYKSSRAGSIPVYCPDEDEVQDRPITSLVPNTTEYELRGWCLAELQWSSLRTSEVYRNPLHASSALPNQHLWARRSPMAPYKFRSELAKKEIKFTHRSDFTPLIQAQQTAFHDKVSQCETRILGSSGRRDGDSWRGCVLLPESTHSEAGTVCRQCGGIHSKSFV
ncbi:unnamed protein product [Symbiodinium necroappetens]|uniref:Uncharacterized protein n=1 Tax=Symbiodinium necroappetens TaxID=1628268 RepID=A0A813BYY3_9DINO|nr:unnamed protein product [Symbiodinium necroappetens]